MLIFFGTTILKFDSFSIVPYIVHTQIAKVKASFSLFALSELVSTNQVYYPLLFLTYLPQAYYPLERSGLTDGQNTSPLVP